MIGKQVAKPYNQIRKVYGLKPIQSSDEIISRKLNLIPISKHVLERNPYWEEQHVLTGYWYEKEEAYSPDEKLAAFLAVGGEKPILLALGGAMAFEDKSEKEKLDMFVNASVRQGIGQSSRDFRRRFKLRVARNHDRLRQCPAQLSFKQCAFVIHHCGFGTAAATMIHGIPSIPVPHVLDQMGFARQLHDINVATKPLNSKDLSEDSIYAAIIEMQSDYEEKKRSAEIISAKIKEEGGVEEAVRLIEKVMES